MIHGFLMRNLTVFFSCMMIKKLLFSSYVYALPVERWRISPISCVCTEIISCFTYYANEKRVFVRMV